MTQPVAAVIGAGVIGCLVARELTARYPEMSVTVLDRDAIGAGTSRRSAGLHLPKGGTPRKRRMSAVSHGYYADLLDRRPELPIYPVGATVIAGGEQGSELGGGYLSQAAPIPAGGDDQAGGLLDGMVAIPAGSAAWRIANCHYADVYALTQTLAAELRPRVRFVEGVAVTGLASTASAVNVTCGTGERLTADFAVLAPGPWLAAPAWRDLIAPLGLRVKKIVALHIERRPAPADEAVLFDDDDAFLLPLRHRGHWLFSYTCREWDVNPDELTAGLSAANIAAARDCLRKYSPALASELGAGRVCCDAYSTDTEPAVRLTGEHGRIVFAGGANGSGYRLGPAIASEAADLLSSQLGTQSEGVTDDHQYV